MFVGIEFDEKNGGGVALIHSNWLTPRKREVWWPPFKQQEHYERSLKKGESPNENWLLYPVERTFFEEDDYQKARCKIKKAELTSDCASETETVPKKRKIIPPKRLFSSSDEDNINTPPRKLNTIAKLVDKKIKLRENSQISSENLDTPSTSTHDTNKNGDVSNFTQMKENNAYLQHIVRLCTSVKKQNDQILSILQQKKTATGYSLDLPDDIPTDLPVNSIHDLEVLESYLKDETKFSSLVSYFATLGGHDNKSKVNNILKNLISNEVASFYSFFGSRNNKKAFQPLKLRKLITNSVLATSNATENDVSDAIKLWLKHAPKRMTTKKSINEQHNDTI